MGLELRVQGSGFRVEVSGLRVEGSGFKVRPSVLVIYKGLELKQVVLRIDPGPQKYVKQWALWLLLGVYYYLHTFGI